MNNLSTGAGTIPATGTTIPRAAIRGVGGGLFLMAFFTLAWMGIAETGLHRSWALVAEIIVCLICLIFLADGIYLISISKQFPVPSPNEEKAEGKRIGKWFGITFGAEGAAIAIVAAVLSARHHYNYFFSSMALIVGLHFYPMAKIFKRKIDYYIATWSCIVAILGLIMVFKGVPQNIGAAFVGIGLAISTCSYGVYMIAAGYQLTRINTHDKTIGVLPV